MSLPSFVLSAHLAAFIVGMGSSTGAWGGEPGRLSITDLQRRLAEIDSELGGLAKISLNPSFFLTAIDPGFFVEIRLFSGVLIFRQIATHS